MKNNINSIFRETSYKEQIIFARNKSREYSDSLVSYLKNADKFSRTMIMLGVFMIILTPAIPAPNNDGGVDIYVSTVSQDQSALVPFARQDANDYIYDGELQDILSVAYGALEAKLYPPQKSQIVVGRVLVPITAYSSTPDQTDDTPFITASGTRTRDGVIAANFLPIGTKVRIPTVYGEKVFVVEDRMNSRYWKRMDIWMATRSEALRFGLRTLPVEIIKEI